MAARYRMLPDGTWLDTVTDTVVAPLVDAPRAAATAGPTYGHWHKDTPTPGAGGQTLLLPENVDPLARQLNGFQGTYLGQQEMTPGSKMMAMGAIIGVCALTVWLNNRSKGKAKKKV